MKVKSCENVKTMVHADFSSLKTRSVCDKEIHTIFLMNRTLEGGRKRRVNVQL